MLEEFYDSELKTFVETELKKTGKALDEHKEAFIKKLINNPLLPENPSGLRGYIKSILRPLASLSTEDFFKRLAGTDIGKQIKAKGEAEIDELVDSLSLAYDEIGVVATDLFKRRAQIFSLAAGILVAFGLNVNALLVFQSYLDDPLLRAKVVAQADSISAKYKESIDKGDVTGFKDKEEAEAFAESFKKDVASLEKSGVTIGYSRDVRPGKLWRKDEAKSADEKTLSRKIIGTVFWGLGVLGTGLLIGLGGPFWFNIARKLTEVIQVARGGAATDGSETRKSTLAAADPMKSHKDTFKKIGGGPPLVKAQANLTTAIDAAMVADSAVKDAVDALKGAQDVAMVDTGNKVMTDTGINAMTDVVAVAEEAMKCAIDAKIKMDQSKVDAYKSLAAAESNRAKPANS